ncbi:invasion associated locus B family protein [Phyllobacterium sp. NPDC097923]|uniref:invasion associated locus B family protein n=1 Tax=Phyllobacterium sp. NPDC097923 TaxID=3364404 RepID=UPI00383AF157
MTPDHPCRSSAKFMRGACLVFALAGLLPMSAQAGVDNKPLLDQVLSERRQASGPRQAHASPQDPLTVKLLSPSQEETFQNWSLLCQEMEAGNDCFLSQTLVDNRVPDGKILLQINGIDENGVRGHVMLPSGFLLQEGITIRIGTSSLQFPLMSCIPEGCVADIRFNQQQLALLQTSTQVDIAIILRSGEAMHFPFALQGFQSAFQKMSAAIRP